jgi:glutamyl-Q tRNA(Asp) synthetase
MPDDAAASRPGEAQGRIVAGEPHAWRLDMDAARRAESGTLSWTEFDRHGLESEHVARPQLWGDAVLARRDIATSYHLSVVVDDALQGITHVVRGQDLAPAPHLHVLLQRLLGLGTPRYHHHPLIRDETGAKLSKSAGSPSLRDLRRDGGAAVDLRRRLGFAD